MHSILVLLAEDEPVIALDLRHQLETYGFEVLEVDDPFELPAVCIKCQPDLLILNFHYKVAADGISLARKLYAHKRLKVLLITGAHSKELAIPGDIAGFVDVLHKPFTRRQLRQCIDAIRSAILSKRFPDDFLPFPE